MSTYLRGIGERMQHERLELHTVDLTSLLLPFDPGESFVPHLKLDYDASPCKLSVAPLSHY